MTYEHLGGTPASPDIDDGVPPICEGCEIDCDGPCSSFDILIDIMELRRRFPNKGYMSLPYNPDHSAGGGPEVYSEWGVEEWLDELDKLLRPSTPTAKTGG